MFERPRKNSLFWLAVAAAGGGLTGFLIVVVSLIVLLALLLVLCVHLDAKSAASYGNPSLSLVDASHNWTGQENRAVVNEALYLAAAMYNGPPDGYDTWYHPSMIPDVFSCSRCGSWPQGNVQCVAFVTAAYGLAGQPLPYIGNAITFYTSGAYANAPGWEMVSPYSMPLPGDIIVLNSPYFGGVGHVVLVVDVQPPHDGKSGYVQFAQANGPGSLNQEALYQDSHGNVHMAIWPHYTVETYLRHVSALTTPRPSA
jgi:hypothetical protein